MVQQSCAAYLEMLATFRTLWTRKEQDLLQQKERYNAGLNKLQFAASQVVVMQEELRRLQPQLVDTSAETESLMVKIEQDTIEVEAQKEVLPYYLCHLILCHCCFVSRSLQLMKVWPTKLPLLPRRLKMNVKAIWQRQHLPSRPLSPLSIL